MHGLLLASLSFNYMPKHPVVSARAHERAHIRTHTCTRLDVCIMYSFVHVRLCKRTCTRTGTNTQTRLAVCISVSMLHSTLFCKQQVLWPTVTSFSERLMLSSSHKSHNTQRVHSRPALCYWCQVSSNIVSHSKTILED